MQSTEELSDERMAIKQGFISMFVDWEVRLIINKADPSGLAPDYLRQDQRLLFSPEKQSKDPAARMKFVSEKSDKAPNFLWVSGLIRRIKDQTYTTTRADRVVVGCCDCLTIFAGAKPGEHLGHRISTRFSNNVKLNSSHEIETQQFRTALINLIEEGQWESPKVKNTLVPQIRWVRAETPHSGRRISNDEICYFSEKIQPCGLTISASDLKLAQPISVHLLSVFKR